MGERWSHPIVTKTERILVQPRLRSEREQQPTQRERCQTIVRRQGKGRERQRTSTYQEESLVVREEGHPSPTTANEKKATELLKKKTTKAVNPNYKPAKAHLVRLEPRETRFVVRVRDT